MYNVGDLVRIRSELQDGRAYDHLGFVYPMKKYRGMVATISSIDGGYYRLSADTENPEELGLWKWNDMMLDPYIPVDEEDLQESDMPIDYLLS